MVVFLDSWLLLNWLVEVVHRKAFDTTADISVVMTVIQHGLKNCKEALFEDHLDGAVCAK